MRLRRCAPLSFTIHGPWIRWVAAGKKNAIRDENARPRIYKRIVCCDAAPLVNCHEAVQLGVSKVR